MKRIFVLISVVFLLISSVIFANGRELLQNFLGRNAKINSFQAAFTQKNYWKQQDIVNTSSGVLYTEGENILLEHKDPEHQYMVGTEDELVFYFPERKKLIGSDASYWQFFLSPQFLSKEYINFCEYQNYRLNENSTTFILKAKKAIDDLNQIQITFSNQDSLIERFFYEDKYNNEVLFTFSNQIVNEDIPDSTFHLEIPQDVEVIDQRKELQRGSQ